MSIADNIKIVQEHIANACASVNRSPDNVQLIAVSKQKPVTAIFEALDAGLTHFGENRLEEAQTKIATINAARSQSPIWHMIGHIQSRKAKAIPPLFDIVHSIDRLKIAQKLSTIAQEKHLILPIFIEVNASGEQSKYGFPVKGWQEQPARKAAFYEAVQTISELPNLDIRGLMTMAPFYENVQETRPIFAEVAELRADLTETFALALPHLSMGMTNDYVVAIEEGATMVRIGRAIFGER